MAIAKFRAGDSVRFIGTDRTLTVTQFNPETVEYRVQRGDDYLAANGLQKYTLKRAFEGA